MALFLYPLSLSLLLLLLLLLSCRLSIRRDYAFAQEMGRCPVSPNPSWGRLVLPEVLQAQHVSQRVVAEVRGFKTRRSGRWCCPVCFHKMYPDGRCRAGCCTLHVAHKHKTQSHVMRVSVSFPFVIPPGCLCLSSMAVITSISTAHASKYIAGCPLP
jgi:hypothetical protein